MGDNGQNQYYLIRCPSMTSPQMIENIETIKLSERIQVSVVIPHFSLTRGENLRGLVDDIKKQTFKDSEIIIVKQVSPQGRAINEGARLAQGEILVVIDDDSRLGNEKVIENLVNALRANPKIGMAGASILTPENANSFQKMAAKQFPRFNMPIVDQIIDSDLPCHGCIAFPMPVFIEIGMEREDILRGLDPVLRVKMRKAGYRVVLVPDTWAYHPLPESLGKFIRTFIRNGTGSAYLQVYYPEISYNTDEKLDSSEFVPKRSFIERVIRYPFRLLHSLVTFQWIRLLGYTVYIFGYVTGFARFSFSRKRIA